MTNFDDDNLQDLSIDEINILFDDIIEMPGTLIASVAYGSLDPCSAKDYGPNQ